MDESTTRNPALLLVGPTGSGKTPLGNLIAERGLWRRKCVHFDFGAILRSMVERNRPDRSICQADIDFLREVLRSGALLEDEHFPIAERILTSFLAAHGGDARTLIVLNGLPRHVGQAEALDSLLKVEAVVSLRCSAQTVLERIRANVGGDRAGRTDDDPVAIRRKLTLFAAQTARLLDHYRSLGTRIETIDVTPTMQPSDMWETLDRRN